MARKKKLGRSAVAELLGRPVSRTEYKEYEKILEARGLTVAEVLSSEDLRQERAFMLLWFALNNQNQIYEEE